MCFVYNKSLYNKSPPESFVLLQLPPPCNVPRNMTLCNPHVIPTAHVLPYQSTLRSLPQTSSAFFLPLVSGTYQEMNAKKKADSAAKMK